MTWALLKKDHPKLGYYVSKPGSKKSYTKAVRKADTWATEEAAEFSACDNEVAVDLNRFLE